MSTTTTTISATTLFAAIVQRLLTSLGQMSHASTSSATRAVAALAEARARAVASARTPAERTHLLGDESMQHLLGLLEDKMTAIVSDTGFSAHQRELALRALLWLQTLPSRSPKLAPAKIAGYMSTGKTAF